MAVEDVCPESTAINQDKTGSRLHFIYESINFMLN